MLRRVVWLLLVLLALTATEVRLSHGEQRSNGVPLIWYRDK